MAVKIPKPAFGIVDSAMYRLHSRFSSKVEARVPWNGATGTTAEKRRWRNNQHVGHRSPCEHVLFEQRRRGDAVFSKVVMFTIMIHSKKSDLVLFVVFVCSGCMVERSTDLLLDSSSPPIFLKGGDATSANHQSSVTKDRTI
jgi:hypothetical protein